MSSRFSFPQGNKSGSEGAVVACENIRFSSLFAAGDVSRETSPAAKSEEKRMFSQATTAPSDPLLFPWGKEKRELISQTAARN